MSKAERDRVVGFISELNASGFSNWEIAKQSGLSVSFVEKLLRGRKKFVWKLPSHPPATRRWQGGSEAAALALKKLKIAIGQTLWALWDTKAAPVPRRGPGRPAAVRPHQTTVERSVRDLATASEVSEAAVWRWVYPSRVAELYRTRKPRPRTHAQEN